MIRSLTGLNLAAEPVHNPAIADAGSRNLKSRDEPDAHPAFLYHDAPDDCQCTKLPNLLSLPLAKVSYIRFCSSLQSFARYALVP
jgi:hypothetical protein